MNYKLLNSQHILSPPCTNSTNAKNDQIKVNSNISFKSPKFFFFFAFLSVDRARPGPAQLDIHNKK